MMCRPLASLLGLAVVLHATAGAQRTASLTWEPYAVRTPDGREHPVELGKLAVPDSRTAPVSPTISVAMLRLPSTNPRPGSPIVFLMGGPGVPASVMAPLPPYWALFDSLRSVADVILLDQRGTGLSEPSYECPAGPSPDAGFMTTGRAFVDAYKAIMERCARHLLGRGVSSRTLTDVAIADDLDALREALRTDRLTLLGFSYGTRLALTYARRHPSGVDRLILQGPTDHNMMYRAGTWHDSLFRMIAREAAVDPATAEFSRDLVTRAAMLLDRVAQAPIPVRLATTTGDSITIPVGRDLLAATITGHIADPRIPALIATLEVDDVSILRHWVASLFTDLTNGAGSLMGRAAACSQLPIRGRTIAVDIADGQSFFGPVLDNFSIAPDFCLSIWGGPFRPTNIAARSLNRPALFIVGSRDDRTPPYNAELLGLDFRSATTLLVANGGHELLPVPEVQAEILYFLRTGDVSRRTLQMPRPRYLPIDAARQPPRRPGS